MPTRCACGCAIGRCKWSSWRWRALTSIAALAWLLADPAGAGAVQRLTAADERTLRAPVSRDQLTVLVFPATVLQAVTSAPGLEVKTSDRHVIVSPPDRPVDLVVTTTQYVYVLMLEPEAKPADTVVIEDARLAGEPARAAGGRSTGHQEAVIELLRGAMTGRWPAGAAPRPLAREAVPTWVDLEPESILGATVRRAGGLYELRRYVLVNRNGAPRSYREQEFYTGEEFGIAISRQVVEPGERLVLGVVVPGREAAPDADPWAALDPDGTAKGGGR